jgi:hypothetical protein
MVDVKALSPSRNTSMLLQVLLYPKEPANGGVLAGPTGIVTFSVYGTG